MTIQNLIKNLNNKKEVKSKMPGPSTHEPIEHKHSWKMVGKTYAPPTNLNLTSVQGLESKTVERAIFGLTTLLWECDCGETKREELLGSADDLLESLIDKAVKIGPQFVDRGGKTFIISEWKPPTQNPNMIPVK